MKRVSSPTRRAPKFAPRLLGLAVALATSQVALAVPGVDPAENVVLQWNDATLEAIRITHPGPPIVARMLAVVNTCTFDAWATFNGAARATRPGNRFKAAPALRTEANKAKAIAYAAYRANLDLFPQADMQQYFRDLMTEQGYDPNDATTGKSTAAGIGNGTCARVLDYRHKDGANQLGDINGGAPYSDYTGYAPVNTPDTINNPNRWQPLRVPDGHGGFVEQKFITPHWGKVEPFALENWDKQVIRPVRKEIKERTGRVGPVTVSDPMYREQADQVIAFSATIVDQQKVIAEYWADGPTSELPPGHWNLFAQDVSHRDAHSVDDDVKLLFGVSNVVFDTSITIWGAKVKFDSVRPVTAIHYLYGGQTIDAWAGPGLGTQPIDGADWQPYQAATVVTPPFAEYPSGHSAFSSSAAEALKRFSGSDVFGVIETIPAGSSRVEPGLAPVADVSLAWATFTDAADEAGISRLYGGIHFRDGDLDSRAMGRRVAELVWPVVRYHFGENGGGHGHDDDHHGKGKSKGKGHDKGKGKGHDKHGDD